VPSILLIRYRHSVAPQLFVGAYQDQNLIGFINATCSPSETLDHDSLTHHDPTGKNVLIHSVCVARNHRRAKVATRMLLEYLDRCTQAGFLSVVLVCHDELKPLYMGVGFLDRGPSQLVHGSRPWSEMILHLPCKNPSKLLCPIESCRCIILRKEVGRLVTVQECPVSSFILTSTESLHIPTRVFSLSASRTPTPRFHRAIYPMLASTESNEFRKHRVFQTSRPGLSERETMVGVWCL
jgi:hypothetical protein